MSRARWTAEEAAALLKKRAVQQDANQVRLLKKAKRCLKPDNKLPIPSEHQVQRAFVSWFRVVHKKIYDTGALFAIPNGGLRGKAEAKRLKDEGVYAGASDLVLLVPRGQYHGLCIEMKTIGGEVSPEQEAWLFSRRLDGYATDVCYTCDEAVESVTAYLKL